MNLLSRAAVSLALLSAPASAQTLTAQRIPSPPSDARIPIQTLSGSATARFVIDQPGSYVLVRNVQGVTGKNGIEVRADDVTIDLYGFSLRGVAGSLDGIHLEAGRSGLTVEHGTIRGWGGSGIAASQGASTAERCRISRVRAIGNAGDGIALGERSRVELCIAAGNLKGLSVRGSHVDTCILAENAAVGVEVIEQGEARRCIARNTAAGLGLGIHAVDGGVQIEECVSNRGSIGVSAGQPVRISNVRLCVVAGTTGVSGGIHASSSARVEDCLSTRNTGRAFSMTGTGPHVEGNLATTSGIEAFTVTGWGFARRNASTANANGDNWNLSGNVAAGSFLPPGVITSSNPNGHPLF